MAQNGRFRARELGFESEDISLPSNDTVLGAVSYCLTSTEKHHKEIRKACAWIMRYLDDLRKIGSPVPDDILEVVADALRVRIVRIDYQSSKYVREFRPHVDVYFSKPPTFFACPPMWRLPCAFV
ncbi:hypothetical protein Tco_0622938 [Tanacetum coccineum]